MRVRAVLRKLWKDPVVSNVVGGGILAVLISLSVYFWSQLGSLSVSRLVAAITLVGAVVAVMLTLLLWWYSRHAPKMLVFLSSGGTCRDPMAKAIATKLFEELKPRHPIKIRAAALGPISKSEASHAARLTIKEMYNEDLLASHKPELLTPELAIEADLILAMDASLLRHTKTAPAGWPDAYSGKTFLLKEFFGLEGDVTDPWPDGKDQVTLSRYRSCANELRQILTQHRDQLANALDL
jgi:protein-tyrosine-phosphatase